MRTRKFWVPVVCSLVVTPLALLLGVASGGAGHGDYFAAMLLFPYTMLSAVVFDYIHVPFILLAVAQFPGYGLSLGYANEKGRFARVAVILLTLHVVSVAAVVLQSNKNFS
ncbi:MAG: hypothetical protein ACRD9R_04420 [Pyrinomonadaceae bacterium]